MRSLKTRLALVLLVLSVLAPSFAQRPKANFNRPQTYDVQHYTIRASFDRMNKKVFGDTTVLLKPLAAVTNSVDLDAVGLTFQSVTLDPAGTTLQYKASGGKVTVTLDKGYGPDETVAIRFKYSTSPEKGVYFRPAEAEPGQQEHSTQIWSQGEAEEARYWFPSFDFPSDKATTEEYITANSDETVIGNGELVGKDQNADGTTTWHFSMPVPHSTYLVSFVIGKYAKVEDRYKDIPLGFYVYPGRELTAQHAFGETKNMIAAYETMTGVPFPYNKYDQTIVSDFQFGGMENISATTMNDAEIFLADVDFLKNGFVIDLVSHELAHSWFGDLVTCRNWAELWLNEGFATYMEAAYRERINGRDDYLNKIRRDAGDFLRDDEHDLKRHGLFNLKASNVDSLFDDAATPITYQKGGSVLHTLREQVGTENFWRAINVYLNRYKFSNVESSDLEKVMEEVSGQDLTWFFDQWVYGVGAPHLDVKEVYSPRTKSLKLTITQTQKPGANVPPVYRLPMDVEVATPAGKAVQKIDINKKTQVFTIRAVGRPTTLNFDPEFKIPLKVIKQEKLVVLK